jgi:hypothetical protein
MHVWQVPSGPEPTGTAHLSPGQQKSPVNWLKAVSVQSALTVGQVEAVVVGAEKPKHRDVGSYVRSELQHNNVLAMR